MRCSGVKRAPRPSRRVQIPEIWVGNISSREVRHSRSVASLLLLSTIANGKLYDHSDQINRCLRVSGGSDFGHSSL